MWIFLLSLLVFLVMARWLLWAEQRETRRPRNNHSMRLLLAEMQAERSLQHLTQDALLAMLDAARDGR